MLEALALVMLTAAILSEEEQLLVATPPTVPPSPKVDLNYEVDPYGLDMETDDLDAAWEVFADAGIERHFSEHLVVVARDEDGDIIGAIAGNDELSVAVSPDRQQEGIGTEMIRQLLEAGGGGFMVAGTEAGASFLMSLPGSLGGYPEELDVPMWESMKEEAFSEE